MVYKSTKPKSKGLRTRFYNNYQQVYVKNKWIFVHQYVWETLKAPRRVGYHIHHISGNKFDNSLSNLVELKAEYHITMHKLIKLLGINFKTFYVMIGMLPEDNMLFYSRITDIAAKYNIPLDCKQFSSRKSKGGSGLDKSEAVKKRMITAGRKALANGKLPYERSTNTNTEKCKLSAIQYFTTLQNYIDAVSSKSKNKIKNTIKK